jgi:hypothetical protein
MGETLENFAVVSGVCILISGIIYPVIHYSSNRIPRSSDVEDGYIAPSRISVEVDDMNRNGKLETVVNIDNKPYLLKEENGVPVLSPYEISSVEVYKRTSELDKSNEPKK